MNRMIKNLVCLFLLSYFVFISNSEAENTKTFLSEHAQQLVKDSNQIFADNIAAMIATPMLLPPGELNSSSKVLNSEQSKALKKYLAMATDISPRERTKECVFQPGISFTIKSEETIENNLPDFAVKRKDHTRGLQILLCFNCDVWAIGNIRYAGALNPVNKEEIVAFGDSKPFRKELLKLSREIFKDSRIKLPES